MEEDVVTSSWRDEARPCSRSHLGGMEQATITATGVIDMFLVLLIGIGPKLALVPFLEITAPIDAETKRRVQRQMMLTATGVALILILRRGAARPAPLLHRLPVHRRCRDLAHPGGVDGASAPNRGSMTSPRGTRCSSPGIRWRRRTC
jgi:hypothetical protein